MKRKFVQILAACVSAAFLLSACGSAGGSVSTENHNGNQGESSETEQQLRQEIEALRQEVEELKQSPGQQVQSSQEENSGASPGSGEAQADTGRISIEEAKKIALDRVPGATEQDISIELDEDDGWYIYEGDILYNRMEYEFEISADTGTILKWEQESW